MENVEESSSDFKKCVSLDPDFAIAVMQGLYADYRNSVQQGSMTGIAKVIEKFKRAIKKFPKCTESYVLLAQVPYSCLANCVKCFNKLHLSA